MPIQIRRMQLGDLATCMMLKEEAGWNQVEADWRRLLALEPDGCFLAELHDAPVATTTVCQFGNVGWIAAVLVRSDRRRQGIATALVTHAIGYLRSKGTDTIRLDATSLGRPVYRRLGFVDQFPLTSFQGTVRMQPPSVDTVLSPADSLEPLENLDRQATHTGRRKLLARFLAEEPVSSRIARRSDTVLGYGMTRPGSKAQRIGPIVAKDAETGRALADWAANLSGGPVVIDIPQGNAAAMAWAKASGLTRTREITRMCLGPAVIESVDQLWASSGPEKG